MVGEEARQRLDHADLPVRELYEVRVVLLIAKQLHFSTGLGIFFT